MLRFILVGMLGSALVFSQTAAPTISTASLSSGSVGSPYSQQLTATGGKSPYSWSLSGGTLPTGITLDASSGTLSGTPTSAGNYQIGIKVTDSAQQSSSKGFTLSIVLPPLVITTTALPAGTVGTSYSASLAATGGNPPYSWAFTSGAAPPGLSLSAAGVVSGVPSAAGSYNLDVQVSDSAPRTAFKSIPLVISTPLSLTAANLPSGTAGANYSSTLSATGGTKPYTWTVSSGALPAGITLAASTGVLSGSPASGGTFTFAVQVTDANQLTATRQFTITVVNPLTIVGSISVPSGTVGVSYSRTFTAQGGTPPYTWSITAGALPAGLALDGNTGVVSGVPTTSGVSSFTLQVKDSAGTVATQTLSFIVSGPTQNSMLTVSPVALSFLAVVGGDAPSPQSVTILSANSTAQTFVVQTDSGAVGTPAGTWLGVSPAGGGGVPGRLIVSVNQAGLAAGTYAARIRVNVPPAAAGSQAPVDIMVSLTVQAAPPSLEVVPTMLRFQALQGSAALQEATLLVRNSGGNGTIPFATSVSTDSPWLLEPLIVPNQTTVGQRVSYKVRINPQGLAVGLYRGVVRLASASGNQEVPVVVVIVPPSPILSLDRTGIRFEARQGNGNSDKGIISVLNTGSPGTTANWTAQILRGSDWLNIGASQGSSSPGNPGQLVLSTNANSLALPPGAYYGLVRIADPKALNSPQLVTVILRILDSTTNARPYPSPQGLLFVGAAGGPSPASQPVFAFTSSLDAVPFQTAATTTDGGNWLSVNPAAGRTSTQSPAQVSAVVNTTGLKAGIYNGEISFSLGGSLESTNVTLIVTPSATPTASKRPDPQLAGCSPTRVSLTNIGLTNSFTVPARWPVQLAVQMFDECGSPIPNGQIIVTFDNGDPPLFMDMVDAKQAIYSTTWAPGKMRTGMAVTATGTATGLQLGTSQLIGSISDNKAPSLAPGGTLNNLNPVLGAALSPGTIAQVFGSDMAALTSAPTSLPLPTLFNGTSVLIGDLEAPVFFASSNQLNIQIPTELQANNFYQIVVFANGSPTVADKIYLSPAQPGVAAYQDGRVIAQHLDATLTLVDSAHPASPGEILTIYLAGLGATNPTVPSGTGAPQAEPLGRVTIPATMTIDGMPVETFYVGLTPGGVGLFQINFRVPADAKSGDLPLVVMQNGAVSNVTKLPVKR